MISITDFLAKCTDCIILFWFITHSLTLKKVSLHTKIITTVFFSLIFIVSIIAFDAFFSSELLYIGICITILLAFSLVILNGKCIHKLVVVLIAFSEMFTINDLIAGLLASTLNTNYSELGLERSLTRIFCAFVSRLFFLFVASFTIRFIKGKIRILNLIQDISVITAFLLSILAGCIFKQLLLKHSTSNLYISIIICSVALINALMLFITIQLIMYNESLTDKITLQERLKKDEKRVEEILDWSKSIRAIRHDVINYMLVLSQYIKCGENDKALALIQKILCDVPDIPILDDRTLSVLSAIIGVKKIICKRERINLKCYIQTNLNNFDDMAFCTVFGNLIDNAIEAEKKVQNKEIRLSIGSAGSYLHITVQNRIEKPVLVNGKMPPSSKKNKLEHGLGLYSIEKTISSLNGAINITEEEGWLIVDVIMLPHKK